MRFEKKRLQLLLHAFQSRFLEEHGRAVREVSDWEPVRDEYQQYKSIKKSLEGVK